MKAKINAKSDRKLVAVLGDRRSSSFWATAVEALIILLFIGLGSAGVLHHELWRDETQSWLLARDSPSVLALFQNAHYEGHPLLWHYCLYAIARISPSPLAMQGFNLLLAIGTVWLIVKKSPFSLLQRSLMSFGYFTFYEYALLSRSYGLGVFLTFLFCALYSGRRVIGQWRAGLLTVVLALLANTSIFGLILSGVLAIALYYRLSFSPKPTLHKAIGTHFFVLFTAWAAAAFQIGRSLLNPMGLAGFDAEARAAAAGNGAAAAIAEQTADAARLTSGIENAIENADKLLQIFLKSHLPLPAFRFHFWNKHLLENQLLDTQSVTTQLWLLVLSAALVALVGWVAFQLLRKTRLFLFIYGLGCVSMIALFVLAYRGTTRHYGHLFILLLACLWLAKWSRQYTNRMSARPVYAKLFTAILCVQVFAGMYAYISDLLYPFSASYQTAQIIHTQLDSLPILAINQRPSSPISGYINRPLFYPEADSFGSFWDISYPEITAPTDMIQALKLFAADHNDFVAILTLPLSAERPTAPPTLDIQYLAYIGPSIVEDEAFYLYRIRTTE